MKRLQAHYLIETGIDPEKAVATMAGEQSTGTFVKIPGETGELMEKYAAKTESMEILGSSPYPSLPFAKKSEGKIHRVRVTLSWPVENIGLNLPNLMATVAGNLFELSPFSGLKLLDIDVPDAYQGNFPCPKFGIRGTYEKLGFDNRPVIGTIIKPSVGLDARATAQQVKQLVQAGLDFIKDDELMGSPSYNRFEDRVEACMAVINDHADRTGRKPMYAFNISGTIDEMLRRHDFVLEKGGTCIMLNLLWVGVSSIQHIASHSQLPIHGHRNGWGIFSRHPYLGIEYSAMSKVWRLAGVDQLHTNGLRNKFCEPDESVITSIKSCQQPLWSPGDRAMPVLSSGQWAGQAFDTYQAVGNTELMYLCGGGIMGHPSGIQAGVESIKDAWKAAMEGMDIAQARKKYNSVNEAFAFFG
ncbi:ribulose-bisphosphate carboxylase large subunit family protein [Negadavirga shengliensis]|uniref:Ribulose-bisphosphate carboxylase large subunit family protein n=1 Tax=Negadavirga shengliensis TaxID=1389218 RepID=A0ABV9T423_9BACT